MAGAFIVARELRRTPGNQAQGSEGKVNRSGALLAMLHAHYASCILQLPAPYGRPAMGLFTFIGLVAICVMVAVLGMAVHFLEKHLGRNQPKLF